MSVSDCESHTHSHSHDRHSHWHSVTEWLIATSEDRPGVPIGLHGIEAAKPKRRRQPSPNSGQRGEGESSRLKSQAANQIKMNLKSGEPHSSKCQRLVSVLLNSFLLSSVDYQLEDNGHLSFPIGFKEEKIFWQPLSSVKRCTGYGLSCIFPLMPFSTHRCRSRQRLPCAQPTLPQGVITGNQ